MNTRHDTEKALQPVTLLDVVDLGPNSLGTIGPEESADSEEYNRHVSREVAKPEYVKPPNSLWACIDGRCRKLTGHQDDSLTANPQTAGSIALTDTSVYFMLEDKPKSLSTVLAASTRLAIDDGCRVMVHGGHDKSDCAANIRQNQSLLYNAENIDVVVALAWNLGRQLGLNEHMTIEDVNRLVITGAKAASDDALWDLSPEEKVDIQLANGAKYVDLIGDHGEKVVRFDFSDMAYDENAFVADHRNDRILNLMAFNVSAGHLMKEYYRRAKLHGQTVEEAASRTMAAILYNIGVAKLICNGKMPVALVGYQN